MNISKTQCPHCGKDLNVLKNAFNRYQRLVVSIFSKSLMKAMSESDTKEVKEAIAALFFNREHTIPINRRLSPKEKFLSILFDGLVEISESRYNLRDSELYINRFPYRKTRISRARYICYVKTNYFNELYILKERLNAYITKIIRAYKKDENRYSHVFTYINPLYQIVSQSLDPICKVRGKHIHLSRYKDRNLLKLEGFEVLTDGDKTNEILPSLFEQEFKKIRITEKRRIIQTNKNLTDTLNVYFHGIYSAIFDSNSNLIYPKGCLP